MPLLAFDILPDRIQRAKESLQGLGCGRAFQRPDLCLCHAVTAPAKGIRARQGPYRVKDRTGYTENQGLPYPQEWGSRAQTGMSAIGRGNRRCHSSTGQRFPLLQAQFLWALYGYQL